MKILHQLGHNSKWNLDAYKENDIGYGFIYSAYNFTYDKLQNIAKKLIPVSLIDLQYFGKKSPKGLGKLNTIPFHPANSHLQDKTTTDDMVNIFSGIQFQESIGLRRVIIPSYFDNNLEKLIKVVKESNDYLTDKKSKGIEYYMTIALSKEMLRNEDSVNILLAALTDMKIIFDGYYVVSESELGYKKKINSDYANLENISSVFSTLKDQQFKLIFGYANWDVLVYMALCNIDFVTIGTYENLRNFNPERFLHEMRGGPSDGWYFSEKLLNFVKAKEITNIRRLGGLSLIENDKNIFSDVILQPGYVWNTHKPDVHKNYLLAITRLIENLSSIENREERIEHLVRLVQGAQKTYSELAKRKIFLEDESSDYFLSTWKSFLLSKQ